jgi:hypothetical protein
MLHPALRKRASAIQGFGLFAVELIPKGTIVWTQTDRDRQFTYEEFLQQPPEIQRLCHVYYDRFVLAADDAEVMNHSCDPNTAGLGDDALVAIRDILPGEEVTYDYATSEIDPRVFAGWECRCGAPNCRKVISARDCLDPAFQQRWADHLPTWTREFIKAQETAIKRQS